MSLNINSTITGLYHPTTTLNVLQRSTNPSLSTNNLSLTSPTDNCCKDVQRELITLKADLRNGKCANNWKGDRYYSKTVHRLSKFIPEFSEQEQNLLKPEQWESIKKRVINAALEAEFFLSAGKKLRWVTGTRSPALIGIDQVAKSSIKIGPALIPTGELLQHNIPPLSGELVSGIEENGINHRMLSGVRLNEFERAEGYSSINSIIFRREDEFAEIETRLTKITTMYWNKNRLKISILRLMQYSSLTQTEKSWIKSLLEQAHQSIEEDLKWQKYIPLVDTIVPQNLESIGKPNTICNNQLVGLKLSNGNVVFRYIKYSYGSFSYRCNVGYDEETIYYYNEQEIDKILSNDQSYLDEGFSKMRLERFGERLKIAEGINELLSLVESNIQAIELNPEQQELINDPFPIVWGATSLKGKTTYRMPTNVCEYEEGVAPHMILGKDIRVAFTDQANVFRLHKAVSKFGVEAMSFDAAYYIISKQATFNSYGIESGLPEDRIKESVLQKVD